MAIGYLLAALATQLAMEGRIRQIAVVLSQNGWTVAPDDSVCLGRTCSLTQGLDTLAPG